MLPQRGPWYRALTRAARRSCELPCIVVGGASQRQALHLQRGRPRSAGSHLSARSSTQAGRDRPGGMRRNDPCLGRLRSSFTFLDNGEGVVSRRGRSFVHHHACVGDWRGGASHPDGVGEMRQADSSGFRDARLFLGERLSEAAEGWCHHDTTVRGCIAFAGRAESLRGARECLSPMRPSSCGVACLSLSRILIVRPVAPNASSIWHV